MFIQLYFGGNIVVQGEYVPYGAMTLIYAISSMLGYFNFGSSPLARMTRVNAGSLTLAIGGAGLLFTG